jgi:uncharacterized RDD family membrane protein YckC
MRKKQTEGPVIWVCRHAPDDVARIDILDALFRAGLIKVVVDRVAQKSSDVLQFR